MFIPRQQPLIRATTLIKHLAKRLGKKWGVPGARWGDSDSAAPENHLGRFQNSQDQLEPRLRGQQALRG